MSFTVVELGGEAHQLDLLLRGADVERLEDVFLEEVVQQWTERQPTPVRRGGPLGSHLVFCLDLEDLLFQDVAGDCPAVAKRRRISSPNPLAKRLMRQQTSFLLLSRDVEQKTLRIKPRKEAAAMQHVRRVTPVAAIVSLIVALPAMGAGLASGYTVTLAPGERVYADYRMPPDRAAVVTVKHVTGAGDCDFALVRSSDETPLAWGSHAGTQAELGVVWGDGTSYSTRLWVRNVGSRTGTCRISLHDFAPAEVFETALAEALAEELLETVLLGILGVAPDDTETRASFERAMGGFSAIMESKDLATVERRVLLNEFEIWVTRELGTGLLGTIAFRFVGGCLEQIYRQM